MKIQWISVVAVLLMGSLLLTPASALAAKGKKNKKSGPSAELLQKYDTDKDGKLSKKEISKMTAADKAKLPAAKTKKAKKK